MEGTEARLSELRADANKEHLYLELYSAAGFIGSFVRLQLLLKCFSSLFIFSTRKDLHNFCRSAPMFEEYVKLFYVVDSFFI